MQSEDSNEKELKQTIGIGLASGAVISIAGPIIATNTAIALGTSGTGVAIASLTGAYQTTAMLACLGGGTIASGGAGMSGGLTVLALFGPIGVAIAAFTTGYAFWKYNQDESQV